MQVLFSVNTSVNQEVIQRNSSAAERKETYIDRENKARKRRRTDPAMIQTNVRLNSLHKLIAGRHPDRDPPLATQLVYYEAALPMLAWKAKKQKNRPVDSMMWAANWTPDLVREYPPEWFYEQEASVEIKSFPTDDDFAEPLAVTYDELQAFGLQRIGAVDKLKAERDAEKLEKKRERDREQKRQKRLAEGATPHSHSLSQTRPWEAEDIHRRTWERRQKNL